MSIDQRNAETSRQEIADMPNRLRMISYISPDCKRVTTWTGELCGHVLGGIRKSRGNIAREVWTFHVVDVHGHRWACRHYPYSGEYVRMTKVR